MDQTYASSGLSYADELMQGNPGMDAARAQQLENWATQNEIAMANRYMNEIVQGNQYQYSEEYEYGDIYEVRVLPIFNHILHCLVCHTNSHSNTLPPRRRLRCWLPKHVKTSTQNCPLKQTRRLPATAWHATTWPSVVSLR